MLVKHGTATVQAIVAQIESRYDLDTLAHEPADDPRDERHRPRAPAPRGRPAARAVQRATATAARSSSSIRPTARHSPPASRATDHAAATHHPTETAHLKEANREHHPHRDDDHHSGTCGGHDGRLRLRRGEHCRAERTPVTELRLGYFANVTHAPALVGLEEGLFEDALGDVEVTTQVFNAGPAAIEALSAGAIDATYIGPNPSINTFIQSGGESARIVAGAATGGAALVVRDGIDSPADLAGTTLATPQLGNTQDVALRSWLADEGFETDTTGGGDVQHHADRERADAHALPAGRRSTARGCRSRGCRA